MAIQTHERVSDIDIETAQPFPQGRGIFSAVDTALPRDKSGVATEGGPAVRLLIGGRLVRSHSAEVIRDFRELLGIVRGPTWSPEIDWVRVFRLAAEKMKK